MNEVTTKKSEMAPICHETASPYDLFNNSTEENRVAFRDAYLEYTGMPYPTFYYKLKNDTFRPLERKAFFEVLSEHPL